MLYRVNASSCELGFGQCPFIRYKQAVRLQLQPARLMLQLVQFLLAPVLMPLPLNLRTVHRLDKAATKHSLLNTVVDTVGTCSNRQQLELLLTSKEHSAPHLTHPPPTTGCHILHRSRQSCIARFVLISVQSNASPSS
ncbi:hypothetical protein CBL_02839 [Carabus blaptoides fortunei]